jgi:hypothetical protein
MSVHTEVQFETEICESLSAQGRAVAAMDGHSKGQPAPDAWIDHEISKVGYEIPFNRHFYIFKPPRPLAEIDADLKGVTDRILTLIEGLSS